MKYTNIPDYFFRKFCECETYDIRQYITNKEVKIKLNKIEPENFPNWFMNYKNLRGLQIMGWAFFAGGMTSLIMFIVLIALAYSTQNSYFSIDLWKACWIFFAFFIFLAIILFPSLYLSSFLKYRSYNKMFLKKYTTIFKQMQQEGYIEKDLIKYPNTLQMAFFSRKQWKEKQNKQLKYYCSWFGLLSLEKFFYDYNRQQFPINMNFPFDNWFICYCM